MARNGRLDLIVIIATAPGGSSLAANDSLMGHAFYGLVVGGTYRRKP